MCHRYFARCLLSAFFLAVALPVIPRALAQSSGTEPVDVMLVLDNSGSMKVHDPSALMRTAVSSFAGDLPTESRLGIVIFDESVHLALPLSSAAEPEFGARLEEALEEIDYGGQWTDIPGGIERALYSLREDGRPGARHVVVFFTDGIVETGDADNDRERARWLRDNLSEEAKQREISLFGVAFTERADFQLIQSVSQTAGGEHYRVLKAADIGTVFERIRIRIEATLPVPQVAPVPSEEVHFTTALVDPQWFLDRWPWVVGLVGSSSLVILSGLMWLRRRRERPPITARLRDLADYTGQEAFLVSKRVVRIGREPKINDLVIPHGSVSAQHATLEFREGSYRLLDHRSSNGTFLNGKKFSDGESIREVVLKHGDHVRFDAYDFEFTLDTSKGLPQTKLSPEAAHSPQGTRLRAAPPVGVPPAGVGSASFAAPEMESDAAGGRAAATKLKPEVCPNHPTWEATELCPICQEGRCKRCMTAKNGVTVCRDCAMKPASDLGGQ